MKRTVNNETRAAKAIRMINAGATWEEVSTALNLSVGYLQKICKEHYKLEKCYNNLLAKAKANKKAKADADKLIATDPDCVPEEPKQVIVVETGYLFDKGSEGIEGDAADVYIPNFCIKELEKLTNSFAVAGEILDKVRRDRTITSVNLRGKEEIFEDPTWPVKDRSRGVVALCCYLWARGYKVKLLTNSREIEDLAILQEIDIRVTRCRKVS